MAQSVPSDVSNASIVIKFHEGTSVTLQGSDLTTSGLDDTTPAPRSLATADVRRDLRQIMARTAGRRASLSPLFRLPRAKLAQLKQRGEQRGGQRLADLSLYFSMPSAGSSRTELVALVEELNSLDSVELAYVQPPPLPTTAPLMPEAPMSSQTPDFTHLQGYVVDGPHGIGVDAARAFAGGRGENVRIIDVERRWLADHEDLPAPFFYLQDPVAGNADHGTSVAGVMVGVENEFGVTGISPLAGIGYASHMGTGAGVVAAMEAAIDELSAGDILLLEMHFAGPATSPCTCASSQCNYVPTEYFQGYFDLIQTATANGVVVVEAGGNGEVDLDDPAYGGLFDRSVRDSGAILVGASSSTSRTPMCWSNYGSRIDLHAWGQNVVTTGRGDLYAGPLAPYDEYTSIFSGTSSASPIVAGAVALLESIAFEQHDAPLSPAVVRDLLVSTGKPQQGLLQQAIGPLPDLAVSAPLVGDLASCGDGICDAAESCLSCPSDCGQCVSSCVPTGCEGASPISIPYDSDGPANTCVFFTEPVNNISSWNMSVVEVNGLDVTNTWVSSSNFPAQCDGGYYLRLIGNFAWSHAEVR